MVPINYNTYTIILSLIFVFWHQDVEEFINPAIMLLSLIEKLPVDLVGAHVFGCLVLRDIVRLERACGSKASHQLFLNLIPFSPPVKLPPSKHDKLSVLQWFATRSCKIDNLHINLQSDSPGINVMNLQVETIDLYIKSNITIELYKKNLLKNMNHKIRAIHSFEDQDQEVMEQLSVITSN